jgi:hypothetical protein
MPDAKNLIKVFRGETINLNPFYKRGSSLMNEEGKKLVGRYATTSAKEATEYASSKFPNKVLSAKISPEDFEMGKKDFAKSTSNRGVSEYAKEKGYNLLSKKNVNNLKLDLIKTFKSNIKALTPLALNGLKVFMSLPAQVAIMSLQSTPTNADEANMVLEDFAQLKEKEIKQSGDSESASTQSLLSGYKD